MYKILLKLTTLTQTHHYRIINTSHVDHMFTEQVVKENKIIPKYLLSRTEKMCEYV